MPGSSFIAAKTMKSPMIFPAKSVMPKRQFLPFINLCKKLGEVMQIGGGTIIVKCFNNEKNSCFFKVFVAKVSCFQSKKVHYQKLYFIRVLLYFILCLK
jgi:hypothetical protein